MTAHEGDYARRDVDAAAVRWLPGTGIEVIRAVRLDRPPRYALFDFDGTLSLVRAGWADVMVPMMVEVLQQTGTTESADELARGARDFVMELNGKQTIYQMIRLAEEVKRRGGTSDDPLVYKRRYHDRLMDAIGGRRRALEQGTARPDEWLVPHARDLLTALHARGVTLYLASGTDEAFVREEARLLGIDRFFGPHIYGAVDDYRSFSKQMVIERLLRENRVAGAQLLGFGDGYVEIDNVKQAGGTAIAVASDELHRSGRPDPWKRDRLIGVGADLVIPDYRDTPVLLEYLWHGDEPRA